MISPGDASADAARSRTETMSRSTVKPVVFPGQEWLRGDAKELGFDLKTPNRMM